MTIAAGTGHHPDPSALDLVHHAGNPESPAGCRSGVLIVGGASYVPLEMIFLQLLESPNLTVIGPTFEGPRPGEYASSSSVRSPA